MSTKELEELTSNPSLERLRGELLQKIYKMTGVLYSGHSLKSLMNIYRGLMEK